MPPVPEPVRSESSSDPTPPKPTLLTIEYGNHSANATLQLDLSSTDVQLEMSGMRQKRDSSTRSALPGPARSTQPPSPTTSSTSTDSGTILARRLVDSTFHTLGDQETDSTLRQVVRHIRKAQEMFYAGRYAEAEDNARRANEVKPTAEGLAIAGSIAWVRKDRDNARRNWLKARELDPSFPGLSTVLDSVPVPRQELSR